MFRVYFETKNNDSFIEYTINQKKILQKVIN